MDDDIKRPDIDDEIEYTIPDEPKEAESIIEAEKEIESEVMDQDPGFEEEKKKDSKTIPRKIYEFLWVSESPWSYAAFVIIAFVVLRFIIFPVFLSATGYSDIAAVVSGSMRHDGIQIDHNFNAWLEFHGYTEEEINEWPYQQGLDVGDVIFIQATPAEELVVGDIILFNSARGQIIHRVVEIEQVNDEYFFTTKGDANTGISPMEKKIPYEQVKGKLVDKWPYLGYPKVALNLIIPNI